MPVKVNIIAGLQPKLKVFSEKKQGKDVVSSTLTEEPLKADHPLSPGKEAIGPEPHATVSYTASRKFNMGNFGSAMLGCSLSLPCTSAPQPIEAAFNQCRTFVDAKMKELLKDTPVGEE